MENKINLKSLYRIGIVVKNAEEKFAMYEKYFGVDRSTVDVTDTTDPKIRYKDYTFNGEPLYYDAKFMIFPLANVEIELIEPLDDKGPYAEFLAHHGEGVHHFNLDIDNVEQLYDTLEEVRAPFLSGGHLESTAYRYYDARDAFGMIIESCEKKPF